MYKRRMTLVAALAVAGLGLVACGEDDGGTPGGGQQATDPPVSSETSESASPESEPPAADAETTPPGTELKVGEKAVVPYEVGDKTGTIAVTVTAIEEGTSADLEGAGAGEDADKITPYYVKLTVENVGGTDLSHTSVSGLRVFAAGGGSTGAVLSGQIPGKCESESAPSDFSTAGATYETCDVSGAGKGVEVGGVEFDEDDYQDDPITWTK